MIEQTPALRPCAHCGGIAQLEQGEAVPEMWCVFCTGCGTTSPAAYKPGAIAAWNRRTAPLDPTNETQVATLALAGFELERDHWSAPDYSQHENRLREWARVTLGKLGG